MAVINAGTGQIDLQENRLLCPRVQLQIHIDLVLQLTLVAVFYIWSLWSELVNAAWRPLIKKNCSVGCRNFSWVIVVNYLEFVVRLDTTSNHNWWNGFFVLYVKSKHSTLLKSFWNLSCKYISSKDLNIYFLLCYF